MYYFPTLAFVFGLFSISLGQYCTQVGPSATIDSNVESVDITGESSSISYTGCPGVIGLQDLTTQIVYLNAGGNYQLDVQFGTCGGNYAGAGQVWIDFDQSGNFDASESVGTWSGTPPVSLSVFNFSIPAGAQNGLTRMRVMQREQGTLPLDPCGTFSWGSVTDFGVYIQNGIDCSGFAGDNQNEAIVINSLPFDTTANTSICYSNQNPVYPSPDMYFKIDPNPSMESLHVSLCGSSFDTFLSVVDALGNIVAFNDDSNVCDSSSELTLETTGLGTLYIIVEGWGSEMGEFDLLVEANYLGLNEENTLIRVYPNPSNGVVRISNYTGKLIVKNTLGQKQFEVICTHETELVLSNLAAGTYFLTDESGSVLDKLILTKND
jgi:hypothetical protein